jgi:hypothetical protein
MATRETRSPLRDSPLRSAGQSLDRRSLGILFDDVIPWLIGAGLFVFLAIVEWYQWYFETSPSPKLFSALALIAVTMTAFKFRQSFRHFKNLKLGRDGERIVAERLQELVASGWHIYHDIQADNFNIDHVAVGPAGIIAFETKTRSKPVKGSMNVVVDEDGLSIAGGRRSWEAVEQARMQAEWLEQLLKRTTKASFHVRPVILFPGWYVDDKRRQKDPWILESKELPKWIARERAVLSQHEIRLVSSHLDRENRRTN